MAETTAHTAAPAGHAKFPPFESEHFPSQLVWLAISFVLLYVLMSRIALPRIGGIMAARNKVISDDLAAAEQLKERSNAANAAYEKALADARSRAQAIAGATREQQARETEDLHKRLEAQLHDRMVAAEQSIAKKARRGDEQCEVNRGRDRSTTGWSQPSNRSQKRPGAAMSNVRSIAAETASAIVERLIGLRPRDEDIAAALDDTGKS
jgi:F-type H+-transporting ATPase subunit b